MQQQHAGASVFRILVLGAFAAGAVAQPLVYNRGVFNAASFFPQGVPGGAIAQGSLFSLFGSNLGPAQGVSANAFPLGTTLSGTSLTVSQGDTTVNAIPVYVSSGQINAIMPSNAPIGVSSLRVNVNGTKSNAIPVRIADAAFGIFAVNSAGSGPGILQNYISAETQPVNAPAVTAKPGQVITLWGTGLGPVTGGDNVAPTPVNGSAKTEVFVGGQPAAVTYHGRAPCCAGTDQIDFVVPDNAPQGCWVPVYVRTNGGAISNFVTIAIQNGGSTCSDSANPLSTMLVSGGNTGAVAMVRENTHEDVGTIAPTDVATDFSVGAFSAINSTPFAFHPMLSLPPAGTCTEYSGRGDLLKASFAGIAAFPAGATLDTGAPVVITAPGGPLNLTSLLPGYQASVIGSSAAGKTVLGNLALSPGTYTVSGGGGHDVGTFTATLNVPKPVTWTNRDQLTEIDRTQPLTISWSGGAPNDVVGVIGAAADLPSNSSTVFACLAQPGASSLTISPDVLANLPPTEPYVLNSADVIYLVSVPQSALASINATGLNSGVALFAYVNGKTVIFR